MAIFIPLVTKFDDKGLQGAQRALAGFQNFAVDVARVAAAAIAGVGVASVREASKFESAIAKVEGLVGVTGQELDDMAAAARRFGIETGKGGQEAAEALFVIASSGLRGADAMEALELSLKASTAGLGETEAIARAVSGALNAYGTDVIDAATATDVIVATARAGNFETEQFAAALGRVLPFAKQAGSSLEDMGGAVALLTRTNTDAAQSVTQVSALFKAFVVPTEEAKKALDNVGLSASDMRDAIANQGLPAALDMLDEKLGGNREQLGRLLGSSEAASAAFQILDADSKTIAETFGVVNDATGITQEAFEVMQDTAENKFAVAMASAKDSLITIGAAILEKVQPHLDTMILWMDENGPAIEQGLSKSLIP
jgi:TP901 family phage tail tape measure protein